MQLYAKLRYLRSVDILFYSVVRAFYPFRTDILVAGACMIVSYCLASVLIDPSVHTVSSVVVFMTFDLIFISITVFKRT